MKRYRIIFLAAFFIILATGIPKSAKNNSEQIICDKYKTIFSEPGTACCSYQGFNFNEQQPLCLAGEPEIDLDLLPEKNLKISLDDHSEQSELVQIDLNISKKRKYSEILIYARNLNKTEDNQYKEVSDNTNQQKNTTTIVNYSTLKKGTGWYLLSIIKKNKVVGKNSEYVVKHSGKSFKKSLRRNNLKLYIQTKIKQYKTQEFLVYGVSNKTTPADVSYFYVGEAPEFQILDKDGDGYCSSISTDPNCNKEELDCNDNNADVFIEKTLYIDADGDGFTGAGSKICIGSSIPPNYTLKGDGTDCDDSNANAWQILNYNFADKDRDGFFSPLAGHVCAGNSLPINYSNESTLKEDCDDSDLLKNIAIVFKYSDLDQDGFFALHQKSECLPKQQDPKFKQSVSSTENIDCEPEDASKWRLHRYAYADKDKDGFFIHQPGSICGQDSPPSNYTFSYTGLADCNDDAKDIIPVKAYPDLDLDGYTTIVPETFCSNNIPANYKINKTETDCEPNDSSKWNLKMVYDDKDRDGYAEMPSKSMCIGANPPSGYVLNLALNQRATDCDPNNPKIWRTETYNSIDLDGDGYFSQSYGAICIGTNLPAKYSRDILVDNIDCNDANPSIFRMASIYADQDQDGFVVIEPIYQCIGKQIPAGYLSSEQVVVNNKYVREEDCNDQNPSLSKYIYASYRDQDLDGYFTPSPTEKICATSFPKEWSDQESIPLDKRFDCNDLDPLAGKYLSYAYTDLDQDQYYKEITGYLCKPTLPTGYYTTIPSKAYAEDCHDSNSSLKNSCILDLTNANHRAELLTLAGSRFQSIGNYKFAIRGTRELGSSIWAIDSNKKAIEIFKTKEILRPFEEIQLIKENNTYYFSIRYALSTWPYTRGELYVWQPDLNQTSARKIAEQPFAFNATDIAGDLFFWKGNLNQPTMVSGSTQVLSFDIQKYNLSTNTQSHFINLSTTDASNPGEKVLWNPVIISGDSKFLYVSYSNHNLSIHTLVSINLNTKAITTLFSRDTKKLGGVYHLAQSYMYFTPRGNHDAFNWITFQDAEGALVKYTLISTQGLTSNTKIASSNYDYIAQTFNYNNHGLFLGKRSKINNDPNLSEIFVMSTNSNGEITYKALSAPQQDGYINSNLQPERYIWNKSNGRLFMIENQGIWKIDRSGTTLSSSLYSPFQISSIALLNNQIYAHSTTSQTISENANVILNLINTRQTLHGEWFHFADTSFQLYQNQWKVIRYSNLLEDLNQQ